MAAWLPSSLRHAARGRHRGRASSATLRDAVIEAGHDTRHELHRIADAIERAAKLVEPKRHARSTTSRDLLGDPAKSDRFEKWVVNEALERLVRGGIGDAVDALVGQPVLAALRATTTSSWSSTTATPTSGGR